MKRIAMWTAVLFVAGCAGGFNASRLVPGQSTSGEVQKALGTPAERRPSSDGETVLWYPLLPYGRVSYAARIGKDDRLIAIEQRITPQNFDKLQPGVSRQGDVRDLLGPPSQDDWFPRQQRQMWAYQAQGPQQAQLYILQFSTDGTLREKYIINDQVSLDGK
jgi:hypothetical protein